MEAASRAEGQLLLSHLYCWLNHFQSKCSVNLLMLPSVMSCVTWDKPQDRTFAFGEESQALVFESP